MYDDILKLYNKTSNEKEDVKKMEHLQIYEDLYTIKDIEGFG